VSIIAIIREALRIGRTHKSLWLFGFLVGFGGNLNWSTGGGQEPGAPAAAGAAPEPMVVAAIVLAAIAVIIGAIILKFLSTGALIEGVRRARDDVTMTVGDGFREGWAHWGVLFRIALLYAAVGIVSFLPLAGGPYLAGEALGRPALFVAIGVAVIVGMPWFVTLYIWQAFAERIAVFENRSALDAMRKARLFLHGRLSLGLRLFVATLLGILFVFAVGILVIAPVALLLFGLASLWGALPSIALGVLLALPTCFVLIAMVGIMSSSVWTIGYLTQVEQ
jgi:hypothetical protein